MAKRKSEDPFWDHSTRLRKEAESFRSRRRAYESEYESGEIVEPERQEFPLLNPDKYYGFQMGGTRVVLKGREFAERVAPANLDLKEVRPTIQERLKVEWRILKARIT